MKENNKNRKPGRPEPPKPQKPDARNIIVLIILLVSMVAMWYSMKNLGAPQSVAAGYTDLTSALSKQEVKALDYDTGSSEIIYQLKSGDTFYKTKISSELAADVVREASEQNVPTKLVASTDFLTVFLNIVPLLFMVFFFVMIIRMFSRSMSSKGGGIMGMGKSTAKLYEQNTGVSFKDVAAQEEAKESLTEIFD